MTSTKKTQRMPAMPDPQREPTKRVPMCEVIRDAGRWAVCSTDGLPDKPAYVRDIERSVIKMHERDPMTACVMTEADKARLTQINKTGDRGGAGNACLMLYMDVLGETMKRAYAACGNPYLVRYSDISDEALLMSVGNARDIASVSPEAFMRVHEQVRQEYMAKLDQYRYNVRKLVFLNGGREFVELVPMDLAKYSRALKDESLVTRCHLASPRMVLRDELTKGFISKVVEEIEQKELGFLRNMPPAFRPAVESYGTQMPELSGHEPEILSAGTTAVEIKFKHMSDRDRFAPIPHLSTTMKGLAEIVSGRFGLRYINTYMGKKAANHLLTLTAMAMKDMEAHGMPVRRTESNFIFVVKGEAKLVEKRINAALAKAFRGNGVGDLVTPAAIAIDSAGIHTNDLRAALALKGMGVNYPTEVLTYVDLVVSAMGIIKDDIVSECFRAVIRADPGSRATVNSVIDNVTRHSAIGHIRDGEDMVWSMRTEDKVLPEEQLWRFASRWGKIFRNNLLEIASRL